MNYKIDWKNLTEKEAQTIANNLICSFNLVAKSIQHNDLCDVSYIEVRGIYDDNLHAKEIIQEKEPLKSLWIAK